MMCVAETQTDFPQNLLNLTAEQLDKLVERKTRVMLAEKMNSLNEKTKMLQQMIDNCSTVILNQTKIVNDTMLEEKETLLGLEQQVEEFLPEKISTVEADIATNINNVGNIDQRLLAIEAERETEK